VVILPALIQSLSLFSRFLMFKSSAMHWYHWLGASIVVFNAKSNETLMRVREFHCAGHALLMRFNGSINIGQCIQCFLHHVLQEIEDCYKQLKTLISINCILLSQFVFCSVFFIRLANFAFY